jgi:glutamate/aspartate transport system permease protein
MGSNWDWQVFLQDPGGKYPTYWEWMLSAWGWTVSVALLALIVALVLGSLVGIIRTLPDSPWLIRFGNAWVELFRNIPLLVQIFLWYHVIPAMVPVLKDVPSFILVVLALGFLPRRGSPSRCAPASRRCPRASATRAWRWASPRRSTTVT